MRTRVPTPAGVLALRVERRQAIAIGMEIGIHNGTLAIAIAIAINVLGNSTMSIPAAIYSLIMFFTATAFGLFAARRASRTTFLCRPVDADERRVGYW